MAGSVKGVEESSNTTKRILGSASPKGKWGKRIIQHSLKNQTLSQAMLCSYHFPLHWPIMLLARCALSNINLIETTAFPQD